MRSADGRELVLSAISDHLLNTYKARQMLMESTVQTGEHLTDLQRIARYVAAAPEPCTATDIARALKGAERVQRAVVSYIRSILAEYPGFVRVGTSRWQLP